MKICGKKKIIHNTVSYFKFLTGSSEISVSVLHGDALVRARKIRALLTGPVAFR